MSIQVPDSGTLSTTLGRRRPRAAHRWTSAWRGDSPGPSCTCHSPGSAIRWTGLVAVRPAHSTSGASSTTASGPVTSVRPRRRDATGRGCAAGGQHLVDGGLLEAVQQFADRLVDPGDAGDGRSTRDDAHLVGVVAGIVRLPQRVAAPPAAHVLVDHRHEVDRLAQRLAQLDEERHVGRVQLHGLRRRGSGPAARRWPVGGPLQQRLVRRTASRSGRSPLRAAGPRRAAASAANRSRHVSASHGLPGAAVSAVELPSPMVSST